MVFILEKIVYLQTGNNPLFKGDREAKKSKINWEMETKLSAFKRRKSHESGQYSILNC
jgi:hypothetical protein